MKLKWRWPWTHARELDQRIAEAREEVKRSRALLERDRRTVIEPAAHAARVNHFSDIVRNGLNLGYGTQKNQRGHQT